MISALPVSGAWVPKTMGAQPEVPRISLRRASLSLPVALASELRSEMRRPQVVVAHLLLHGVDDGAQLVVEWMELPVRVPEVERLHPIGHEVPGPVKLRLELGVGREVPGHGVLSYGGGQGSSGGLRPTFGRASPVMVGPRRARIGLCGARTP